MLKDNHSDNEATTPLNPTSSASGVSPIPSPSPSGSSPSPSPIPGSSGSSGTGSGSSSGSSGSSSASGSSGSSRGSASGGSSGGISASSSSGASGVSSESGASKVSGSSGGSAGSGSSGKSGTSGESSGGGGSSSSGVSGTSSASIASGVSSGISIASLSSGSSGSPSGSSSVTVQCDQATHFEITGPKLLVDPIYTWATVATNQFRIIVKVLRADSTIATGYRGTVTISANNGSGGKILLTSHTFTATDAGIYTFNDLVLKSVYNHDATRIIYADSNDCNLHGQIPVAVWFYVICTEESLYQSLACGGTVQPDSRFATLPYSPALCNVSVRLQTPDGSINASTTIQEVGPWFPFHIDGSSCFNYPNDPYWNGTGVPRAAGMIGQVRDCDPKHLEINGSGMDLGPSTFNDLGSPDHIYWRFG